VSECACVCMCVAVRACVLLCVSMCVPVRAVTSAPVADTTIIAVLQSSEAQLPGTTSGRQRALKVSIPFQPAHRLTPASSDSGPDTKSQTKSSEQEDWPDKLPVAAASGSGQHQSVSVSLPAEDPFGAPVEASSSATGDALFDAFAMSSECTA
jgi:hypothetical protein